MRLLVCGCTVTLGRMMAERPDRFGVLMTPRSGHRIEWANRAGVPWAGDNDCFNGLNAARWLGFLRKILRSGSTPAWIACPDVVADMGATWSQYDIWAPVLRSLGLPVALVAQDGLERLRWRSFLRQEWQRIACLFIGGSTQWKLGPHARALIDEAKTRGKWVHVGRVNSLRRIRHFAEMGVDSIDGTGFSAFGDKRMGLAVKWIDRATREVAAPNLFRDALPEK